MVTSIHDGHYMRDELLEITALDTTERMREEDPYTAYMAEVADNRANCALSRFEVDLNRRRDAAIYLLPEHAWGLNLWKESPTERMVSTSMQFYDAFYVSLKKHLQRMIDTYGKVVVLDLHTYNHRRKGPYAEAADPKGNPEINIGSANNSTTFRPLLSDYVDFLSNQKQKGEYFQVGENVKFDGGGMSEWIYENFKDKVCTISVEFKKTFMDEWTGVVDVNHLNVLRSLVKKSVRFLSSGLEHHLEGMIIEKQVRNKEY